MTTRTSTGYALVIAGLSFVTAVVAFAWSDPNLNMPSLNPTTNSIPLNSSDERQTKQGHLDVHSMLVESGALVDNDSGDGNLIVEGQLYDSGGNTTIEGDLFIDNDALNPFLIVDDTDNEVGINKTGIGDITANLDVAGESLFSLVNASSDNALRIEAWGNDDSGTGLDVYLNSSSDCYFAIEASNVIGPGSIGAEGVGGVRARAGSAAAEHYTWALFGSGGGPPLLDRGNWAGYFKGRMKIEIAFQPGPTTENQTIYHTATKLTEDPYTGKVLIIGGVDAHETYPLDKQILRFSDQVSVFDSSYDSLNYNIPPGNPVENASLNIPRSNHTATLMPGTNYVVVAGGFSGEVGAIEEFEPTNSIEICYISGTADVCVGGPDNGDFCVIIPEPDGCEDPGTCTHAIYTSCDTYMGLQLNQARANHAAVAIDSDEFLVFGGEYKDAQGEHQTLNSIERCNTTTKVCQTMPPQASLAAPRANLTATLLTVGNQVLIAGGHSDYYSYPNTTEIYQYDLGNPTLDQVLDGPDFSSLGAGYEGRTFHTATLLSSGEVFIAGGYYEPTDFNFITHKHTDTTAIYDTGILIAGPNLLEEKSRHAAVLLPDNKVMILGGERGGISKPLGPKHGNEIFNIATKQMSEGPPFLDGSGRMNFTASMLDDDRILVIGGQGGWHSGMEGPDLDDAETFDYFEPHDDFFDVIPSADYPGNGADQGFTELADGRVMLIGGKSRAYTWDNYITLWDYSADLGAKDRFLSADVRLDQSTGNPTVTPTDMAGNWWQDGNDLAYRQRIKIVNNDANPLNTGYTITVPLEIDTWRNRIRGDFKDLHIVYYDSINLQWTEVDRLVAEDETYFYVDFALQEEIAGSTTNNYSYSIYYGYTGEGTPVDDPPADKNNIYEIWEDFSSGEIPSGWEVDLYAPGETLDIDNIQSEYAVRTLSHGDRGGVSGIDYLDHTSTITITVKDSAGIPIEGATVTMRCDKVTPGDCTDAVFLGGPTAINQGDGTYTITFTAPLAEGSYSFDPITGDYDLAAQAQKAGYDDSQWETWADIIITQEPVINDFDLVDFICISTCDDGVNNDPYYCDGTVRLRSEGIPVTNADIDPNSCPDHWIDHVKQICMEDITYTCIRTPENEFSDGDYFIIESNKTYARGGCDFYVKATKVNYQEAEVQEYPIWYEEMCIVGYAPDQTDQRVKTADSCQPAFINSLLGIDQVFAREYIDSPVLVQAGSDVKNKIAQVQPTGIVLGEKSEVPLIQVTGEQLEINSYLGAYGHIEYPETGIELTPYPNLIFQAEIKTEPGNKTEDELSMGLAIYWDKYNWVQLRQTIVEGEAVGQWMITGVDGESNKTDYPPDPEKADFFVNEYYCVRIEMDSDGIDFKIAKLDPGETCDNVGSLYDLISDINRPESTTPAKIIVGTGTGIGEASDSSDLDNVTTVVEETNQYYADNVLARGVAASTPEVSVVENVSTDSSSLESILILGGETKAGVVNQYCLYYPDFSINDTEGGIDCYNLPDGGRARHTATVIEDGRIFIAGGYGDLNHGQAALSSVLIFQPLDGSFEVAPFELLDPRANHTAHALGGNKVLLIGGNDTIETNSLNTAETVIVDNPGLSEIMWDIKGARSYHSSTEIDYSEFYPADTKVIFVAGGKDMNENLVHGGKVLDTTAYFLFDEVGGLSVNQGPILTTPRFNHTATVTPEEPEERIIIIGGESHHHFSISKSELIEKDVSGSFIKKSVANPEWLYINWQRTRHNAFLAPDNQIYVFGGMSAWWSLYGLGSNISIYEEASVKVGNTTMVENLNADYLDGYDSSEFVLVGEEEEMKAGAVEIDQNQVQIGNLHMGQLSFINDSGLNPDQPAGLVATSSQADDPAISVQPMANGDNKSLYIETESKGEKVYGLYAKAGEGSGQNLAGYFEGPVYLANPEFLTLDSADLITNLNVDHLNGYDIDDFVLKKDLANYVKFNSPNTQIGNIHMAGIVSLFQDSDLATLSINSLGTDPAIYAYNGGISLSGGQYSLLARAGLSSEINWAGYFQGDVEITGDLEMENGKLVFSGEDTATGSGQIWTGNNCSDNICRDYLDNTAKVILSVTEYGQDSNDYNVRVQPADNCFQVCTFGDIGNPAVNFDYLIIK